MVVMYTSAMTIKLELYYVSYYIIIPIFFTALYIYFLYTQKYLCHLKHGL